MVSKGHLKIPRVLICFVGYCVISDTFYVTNQKFIEFPNPISISIPIEEIIGQYLS